jgi:hypothetical protein
MEQCRHWFGQRLLVDFGLVDRQGLPGGREVGEIEADEAKEGVADLEYRLAALVDQLLDRKTAVDPLEQLRLQLTLKSEHALEFPIETPAQAIQWVQISISFQLAEKRLALEEKKLAARCAADARRHELAQKKLDLAERELAEKAAARQQADRWHLDQEIRVRNQEEADRQARITASPLAQLRWKKSGEDAGASCPDPRSVIPLASPAAADVNESQQALLKEPHLTSAVQADVATGDVPLKLSA